MDPNQHIVSSFTLLQDELTQILIYNLYDIISPKYSSDNCLSSNYYEFIEPGTTNLNSLNPLN